MYKVFVQTDERGSVIYINSSFYVSESDDYIVIDEGEGERYKEAKDLYLEKGLYGHNGTVQTPNYKIVSGELVERTKEEQAKDPYSDPPKPSEDAEEILNIIKGES